MQQKILSKTTGVAQKLPANGGLFKTKILNLFNETLSIFSLTDNIYQRQLDNITEEEKKMKNMILSLSMVNLKKII